MLASEGASFMRQFRELGLTQKVFARGSMGTAEFLYQVRDNPTIADGVVEATYWTTGLDPGVGEEVDSSAARSRRASTAASRPSR